MGTVVSRAIKKSPDSSKRCLTFDNQESKQFYPPIHSGMSKEVDTNPVHFVPKGAVSTSIYLEDYDMERCKSAGNPTIITSLSLSSNSLTGAVGIYGSSDDNFSFKSFSMNNNNDSYQNLLNLPINSEKKEEPILLSSSS